MIQKASKGLSVANTKEKQTPQENKERERNSQDTFCLLWDLIFICFLNCTIIGLFVSTEVLPCPPGRCWLEPFSSFIPKWEFIDKPLEDYGLTTSIQPKSICYLFILIKFDSLAVHWYFNEFRRVHHIALFRMINILVQYILYSIEGQFVWRWPHGGTSSLYFP